MSHDYVVLFWPTYCRPPTKCDFSELNESGAGNLGTATSTTIDGMMESTRNFKRMELRVACMEFLHGKGKEDALATVALSVADLRSWLTEVDAVSDDEYRVEHAHDSSESMGLSNAVLVLRHLKAMPPSERTDERREAVVLCLEILHHVATNSDVVSSDVVNSAAYVAVMLHEFDLHPLVAALLERYGAELDTQETQLWRLLIVVRNLLKHAPTSTNYDELLYHETIIDEYQESIRLADVINAGLASTIAGCRIEAVRVLQKICFHLRRDTAVRVIDILLDAVADESNEEVAQFVVTVVWEVMFVRPLVGREILSRRDEATTTALLDKLKSPSIMVRRVSVHAVTRLIAHARSSSRVELNLLCRIVQIYASGTEGDDVCQRLMFSFFEEILGSDKTHRSLVKMAVLQSNRDAFLAGVPLPMHRTAPSHSQQRIICTNEETVLYRQNKLLTASLGEDDQQEVVMTICRMLQDEFSTTYTPHRVSELLGLASHRHKKV